MTKSIRMIKGKLWMLFFAAAFCIGIFLSHNVLALNVGLIGADTEHGVVKGYLSGTGMFNNITYIDGRTHIPSLSTLNAFDAVLVWSNYSFSDSTTLGNNLADYVDAGGGVVLAPFDFSGISSTLLKGRIMSSTYSPYSGSWGSYTSATLGSYDGSSPLMNGVASVSGKYRNKVALNSGATLVASWSDGRALAAWNHNGDVVGINLYPGEATISGMGGDYARLFANSLAFSAGLNPIPEPTTLLLLGSGILGLLGIGGVRKRLVRKEAKSSI